MNNKKSGISLRAILLYISLCTFVVIGVTFSKYITMSNGGDEARVVKFNEVVVSETNMDADRKQNFILTPGTMLNKDPKVTFGGAETLTYIFLEVDGKGFNYDNDTREFTSVLPDMESEGKVHFFLADEWEYVTTDGDKYVFVQTYHPTGEINEVDYDVIRDNTVYVDWSIRNSELNKLKDLQLTFNATATQTDGRSAEEMWKLVKSK